MVLWHKSYQDCVWEGNKNAMILECANYQLFNYSSINFSYMLQKIKEREESESVMTGVYVCVFVCERAC